MGGCCEQDDELPRSIRDGDFLSSSGLSYFSKEETAPWG